MMIVEIKNRYYLRGLNREPVDCKQTITHYEDITCPIEERWFNACNRFPWEQWAYCFQCGNNYVGWNHDSNETHYYTMTSEDSYDEYVFTHAETDSSDATGRINEVSAYTFHQLPFYEWRRKISVSPDYMVEELWEQRNL